MLSLLWRFRSRARRSGPARADRRVRLSLEALEDRLVPAITDMTQLAALFPTPTQPAHLYVNFDGFDGN